VRNRQGSYPSSGVLWDTTYSYQNDAGQWDHAGNPLRKWELVDGTTYTTRYSYDRIYRLTHEDRTPAAYSEDYGYDAVGNRVSMTRDGVGYSYSYDDHDKLLSVSAGGQSAGFGYDASGNMLSVSGNLYGAWSFSYDDESRLASLTFPWGAGSLTETSTYNYLGQRMRTDYWGTGRRYFYHGDRVLEITDDANTALLRSATEDDSYYAPLLQFQCAYHSGVRWYPLLDGPGNARRLVCLSGGLHSGWWQLPGRGRQPPHTGEPDRRLHWRSDRGTLHCRLVSAGSARAQLRGEVPRPVRAHRRLLL
jgi:hypothetical protein